MGDILYKDLSYAVVGAAMEVHKILGPGYLEAVYQAALAHELELRGISAKREQHLLVSFKGVDVGYYMADFVIEDKIILELKAVTKLAPQHKAQAINYLTTTGFKLALLINFGEKSLNPQRVIRKRYK
ncbi:MAG: GxxExxY protein [Chloroflexi bacterium]|nr:GxxExxY protein [Chloroflexota bacterium]